MNYQFQDLEEQLTSQFIGQGTDLITGISKTGQLVDLGSSDAILVYHHQNDTINHNEMEQSISLNKPVIFLRSLGDSIRYEEIGDHRLNDDLIGRVFDHGIYDCGSALRSYFWQCWKILITDMPRDANWWLPAYNGPTQPVYANFVSRHEWEEITDTVTMETLARGDVFTYAQPGQASEIHGGVFVGNGTSYHHPAFGVSTYEPVLRWFKRRGVVRWYRRYTMASTILSES